VGARYRRAVEGLRIEEQARRALVPRHQDWHGFYSTELSMQSYSQWCEQHRPLAKAGDQLGSFFGFASVSVRSEMRRAINKG
jgi:hypothetical protein